MKATFTYWKESDGKYLGYLNSHPDHWTQGEDLDDLKAHLRDLYKTFSGGFLAMAGAGSPDNLARRPIRVLLADEVDKYPITREGDPITLAEERTASFGANRLSVRACSPTVASKSAKSR